MALHKQERSAFEEHLERYADGALSEIHSDPAFWEIVHDVLMSENPKALDEMNLAQTEDREPAEWADHAYYVTANEVFANIVGRMLVRNRYFIPAGNFTP